MAYITTSPKLWCSLKKCRRKGCPETSIIKHPYISDKICKNKISYQNRNVIWIKERLRVVHQLRLDLHNIKNQFPTTASTCFTVVKIQRDSTKDHAFERFHDKQICFLPPFGDHTKSMRDPILTKWFFSLLPTHDWRTIHLHSILRAVQSLDEDPKKSALSPCKIPLRPHKKLIIFP